MELLDEELTSKILGAAIEVHRILGPGLLEEVYEECLAYEFNLRGIQYIRQEWVDIYYKDLVVPKKYKLDFLVEDRIMVELKSVEDFAAIHESQLLTHVRLCNKRVGLLINLNVKLLKDGIMRRVI